MIFVKKQEIYTIELNLLPTKNGYFLVRNVFILFLSKINIAMEERERNNYKRLIKNKFNYINPNKLFREFY